MSFATWFWTGTRTRIYSPGPGASIPAALSETPSTRIIGTETAEPRRRWPASSRIARPTEPGSSWSLLMKDRARRGVRPREQRWEFWSFEPGAEDVAGPGRPPLLEVYRPASGIQGVVFYHLPVDTGIRVREGRSKSNSNGAAPLTAVPGPLRPEEALSCRTSPPASRRRCRGKPPTTRRPLGQKPQLERSHDLQTAPQPGVEEVPNGVAKQAESQYQ